MLDESIMSTPIMRHYEPVIGALWGQDLATFDRRLLCCWRQFVTVVRGEPFAWALQHGDNPEHRSQWFDTCDLLRAQKWLEGIHIRGGAI